jgi:hypothetical protein
LIIVSRPAGTAGEKATRTVAVDAVVAIVVPRRKTVIVVTNRSGDRVVFRQDIIRYLTRYVNFLAVVLVRSVALFTTHVSRFLS